MIRTLTFVAAMVVAAVAIAPTALGEGRLAPLYPSSQAAGYRDAAERPAARPSTPSLAVTAGTLQVSTVPDAVAAYRDAADRADAISTTGAATAEAQAVSSRDVNWPQLGIGFALGVALALGLGLAVQALRACPLAH